MLTPFGFVSELFIYALNLAEGSLVTAATTTTATITTLATRVGLANPESPAVQFLTIARWASVCGDDPVSAERSSRILPKTASPAATP